MTVLWIAFGVPAILVRGVRVGWSFGYKDGFSDARRDRRRQSG